MTSTGDIIQDTLRAIQILSEERGFPPTVRELGQKLGVASTATVQQRLDIARREGWVMSEKRIARSVRLTSEGIHALRVGL